MDDERPPICATCGVTMVPASLSARVEAVGIGSASSARRPATRIHHEPDQAGLKVGDDICRMLFDPDAHEPLVEDDWDPDRARAAIREIAEDAEESFDEGWRDAPPGHRRRGRGSVAFAPSTLAARVSSRRSTRCSGEAWPTCGATTSPTSSAVRARLPGFDHERSLWRGRRGSGSCCSGSRRRRRTPTAWPS